MILEHEEVEAAAPKLGISIVWVEVRRPIRHLRNSPEKCQAIIIAPNGVFLAERRRLASLAAAARLPDIYAFPEHVEAGGMISYGVEIPDNYRRAASYVDKIWKGTPPGELPIEFPTKLELLVNLKTAKALGIEIPPTLLARADVIE
jgi:putative ABC transport system substrate-binding protein